MTKLIANTLEELEMLLDVPAVAPKTQRLERIEEFTYEVGCSEELHPDKTVAARMHEVFVSTSCRYGCKVYSDPLSNVFVLGHNRTYGCPK